MGGGSTRLCASAGDRIFLSSLLVSVSYTHLSCTASINMVSVLSDPAEPPKSRMSASESSAACCAAVAGIQR